MDGLLNLVIMASILLSKSIVLVLVVTSLPGYACYYAHRDEERQGHPKMQEDGMPSASGGQLPGSSLKINLPTI